MEKYLQVVVRSSAYLQDEAVSTYIASGWKLCGSPFHTMNGPAQIMVRGDSAIPSNDGSYRLVSQTPTTSLKSLCEMYMDDGWQPYGDTFLINTNLTQAMIKGTVPIYREIPMDGGGSTGEIPEGFLARLVAVEGDVASASLLASDVKTTVDNLQLRIGNNESQALNHAEALVLKADLVQGKVPYEQLPSFPVGRKLNVANKAARLSLPAHSDLTIAYESDTGDAWGLDADDDPAIEANWSKLGNTQAIGVASFNGRVGNIAPQSGDYLTDWITETPEKRFVSTEQITLWNSAPNPGLIDSKLADQKLANDALYETKEDAQSTFVPKSAIGAVNGIAPLDDESRVALNHLPVFMPQRARLWRQVKAIRSVGTNYKNNTGNDMQVYVRSAGSTSTDRYIRIAVYNPGESVGFEIRSDAVGAAGYRWLHLNALVPAGGSYTLFGDGGTTNSTIEYWSEFS